MNKVALISLLALIAASACSLNVEDIQSLYHDVSGSHAGRIMMDPGHNRIILTAQNYVLFVDTKTKALLSIDLNQYTSLSGEFLDTEGSFFVFGSRPNQPLVLIQIDGFGKYSEKTLVNLASFGCVLFASDSKIFLTTKQNQLSILASYDYKTDNITGGTALIEDYTDNDCIRHENTGFFLTNRYMIAADMTNARIIKHIDTRINDNAAGYNRMALEPANGVIYVTYSLSVDAIQYNIAKHTISMFKGDADQYAGYLGLATHPSDGHVYFFTSALKRSSVPSTTIIETDMSLKSSNSFNIPNDIFFYRRGHFDLKAKRLYVLGYQTEAGQMNIYSVGLDRRWFGLSMGAIIGISVGGGVALLMVIAGIAGCLYYNRNKNVYEEKSRLLGTTTTYISTA